MYSTSKQVYVYQCFQLNFESKKNKKKKHVGKLNKGQDKEAQIEIHVAICRRLKDPEVGKSSSKDDSFHQ